MLASRGGVPGDACEVTMTFCLSPDRAATGTGVFCTGGQSEIVSLSVFDLRSIWGN